MGESVLDEARLFCALGREGHQRTDTLLGSASVLAGQRLGLSVARATVQPAIVEHHQENDGASDGSHDQRGNRMLPEQLVAQTVGESEDAQPDRTDHEAVGYQLPKDPMAVAAEVRGGGPVFVGGERAAPQLVVPGIGVECHV